MGKKFSNPLMDGLTGDPSRQKESIDPINPVLQNFGKYVDKRIPSTDDSNKNIDLSTYTPYLGNSFVFTGASDKNRAINQSTGEQFGNAVLRLLPNTALEFINMTAGSLDLEDYVNSDNEVGNWLSTWATEQKKKVDKATPIYREDPNKFLDIGDPAWWMENGTNLVQSAAAFVGLGYLSAGGIGAISKGFKALQFLETLAPSAKVARGVETLANAAILNQAEGVGISVGVFDTAYKNKLAELQADEDIMKNNTPEQIDNIAKQTAAEKASSALNFNRLNILLNLTSANLFFKAPVLTRETLTAPSIAKSFKRVLEEGLQESGEEAINLVAEKQAISDKRYTFEDALKDVATKEGAENILMGFIGGAAQTGMTLSGRLLPTKKVDGERVSQNTLQKERFVAQQQAKARWENMSKGEKLTSKTDAFLTLQEQSKLIEDINTANEDKDFKTAKELSDKLLTLQASEAFNTGTTEQLLDTYKAFGNMSEEEATKKGIYNNESINDVNHYRNKAKKAIDTILSLEKVWNDSKDYINQTPIYGANDEKLWEGVYNNRAESVDVNNKIEEINRVKDSYKNSIVDILDKMGVEDDAYSFNTTTGELSLLDTNSKEYKLGLEELLVNELKDIAKSKNIPKYYSMNKESLINSLVDLNNRSKDTIKELLKSNTYNGYKSVLNLENNLKEKRSNLESEFINLTSDSTQKDIANYYKKSKKDINKKKAEERKQKSKTNINNEKANKKAKFNSKRSERNIRDTKEDNKEGNNNRETIKETSNTTNNSNNSSDTSKFMFSSNSRYDDQLNEILHSNQLTKEQKLKTLKSAISEIINLDEDLNNNDKNSLKKQYNNAKTYIESQEDNIPNNDLEQKGVNDLNELANLIESDLSISDKKETPSQKRRRKTELMLNIIDVTEKLGISDFKSIAKWANKNLGSDKFSKIFVPFQDLYNGVIQKGRVNYTYDDIFSSDKDKQDFLTNDDKVSKNVLPFGVYTVDHDNLDNIHKATITKLAQLNSLDIEGKYIDYGDINDGVYKVVFGHNKIAYLARNYIKTIDTDSNGNIRIRKSDIDNNINNISDALLDYSKLKTGSKITLVPLSSVELEDGSVVNADGTIQYKDGRVEERNPQEVAPIGIMYDGELLTGAYLHIADWINEENVVADVKLDRELLIQIRREVLNAGEEGITTTINTVSPGWLMVAKDSNGDTVIDSTLNHLPDVTTFGIKKNGKIHTSFEDTTDIANDMMGENSIMAVVDVTDNTKLGIALNKNRISSDYAESIKEAVKIFINQDSDSPVVKIMEDKYGINLLSMEGLKDYIGRFIYTYNSFEGNTEQFKEYLKGLNSNIHLLRLTGNSIEFGRGNGIKFNSISKNTPKQHLDTFLNNLEKHLLGTYINFDVERLNTDEFVLPIISNNKVTGDKESYNNFIKRHTKTKYFSTKTESGKPIYTIQKTFEFDTKSILEDVVDEELKKEIVGNKTINKNKVSSTRTIISPTGKKITISANDTPPSDLSPKLIEETKFQNILNNIPSDIYIKDLGFNLQNSIVDYITADVLGKLVIDNETTTKTELLSEYIKMFQEYRTAYQEMGNEAMAELAQKVVDNGKDIISIVTNNLARMNTTDISLVKLEDEDSGILDGYESETEVQRFDSEAVFKVNPISSLTNDIKKYLSAVYDVKVDNENKPILDENGNVINKTTVFGLDVIVPFDIVVNDLYSMLANTNEEYIPPIFDVMMDKLKSYKEAKPYLDNVISLLKDAPEEIKSKFVTAMSKHYTHHKYVYRIYDHSTKSYKLIPLDSDNFSNKNKVLQDWNNRLKKSKYIKNNSNEVEELVVINKEEINNRFNDIVNNFKSGKPITIELQNWLNDIGIKLPITVLIKLKNLGYFVNGQRVNMEYMLTNPIGVFNLINKSLTERGNESININNPFKDKAVTSLAREVAKHITTLYSNSFSDVRGETYFGYSPNKYFIERYQNLTNDLELLTKLQGTSFSGTSTWLKELIGKDKNGNPILKKDGLFYRNFQYFTSDGMKDQKGNEGKKLEDMSPADHELYKLSLFFNQGGKIGKGGRRVMNMLYPTISDKSLMLGMKQVGYHINTMSDGNISNSSPIWDILYDTMIQSEINRISEFQSNSSNYNIKGFDKGAEMFYLIPELNNLESIWEEGILKPIVKGSPEYDDIRRILKSHIISLIEQKKDLWRTYGFIDKNKEGLETINITDSSYTKSYNNELNSIANNFVVNYLLFNTNAMQTFIGDPALFFKADSNKIDVLGNSYATAIDNVKSTFINMGVRLASHIAPGLDIPADKGTTFTTVFVNDREGDTSVNKEYLKKILSEEDYNNYSNIAGTDAQEFTTLEEHLDIMHRQGRISRKDMNTLLERESKGLPLDIRTLTGGKDTLQPMKLVYMNKVWDNNMEKIVYVKSSSFPLIKQLTRGLEIDKLRRAMEAQKVNRIAFSSAVKLGNVKNPITIFDKDGRIKNNFNLNPHIQVLPRYGHRRQLEVPFNENKYKINDGTQQSKLLFTNILDLDNFNIKGEEGTFSGKQLRDKFNYTYGKLFKIKYNNLMNEITTDKKLDLTKVQKLLYTEGIKRNFPLNDLQSISLINKNGNPEFVVPLWATASASKFEALLSSIVDNRIRKRMVNGKSYVLGTEEGFNIKEVKKADTLEEIYAIQRENKLSKILFDEQWLKESGGKLRPMREENGKIMPDEVLLPMKFYNNEGKLIDLKQFINKDGYLDTERIDPQLLEQFGFRIPTQGHNSMTYIKVVGFLPYESGDLLIAPRDFTKRMGSDFDVDKLYVISYNTNYNSKEGTIKRVTKDHRNWSEEKGLQDELLDVHFSVLGNTDPKVQRQIHTPLGFGLLEDLANQIDNAYQNNEYHVWSGISEEYQKNRYLSARGAGIGVGAFSLDNTFNSLLQGNDSIKIMKTIKIKEDGKTKYIKVPYRITLDGRQNNELSDSKVNTEGKERFKSEVISAYQSASVDNEKVQLLNRLNINKYTFSTIKLLNQLGFEEDVVMYFINQPIIRDYVRLMSLANDNSSNWTTDKVEIELSNLYPSSLTDEDKDSYSNIPLGKMQDMVHNTIDNDLQQVILYKFLETTKFGNSLGTVQSTINSDSAGVGKDLFYSLIKEDQILDLINNGIIFNAHKLIGDYWSTDSIDNWNLLSQEDRDKIIKELKDNGYVKARGQLYIKPTTINGYASIYGTLVNAKLWNKLFGYDSVALLRAVEEIANITGKNSDIISIKADAYRKGWNFIKSYIMSQSETLSEDSLSNERKRLLYDTNDNISLASIVMDIQDKGLLKNNPFINRLETEIFKEVLPSKLTYNSSLEEGYDERYIYSGFIDLLSKDTVLGTYNGIEYTTKTLAQDLVTHQFITGGVQRANQFIKYIPVQYLNELGYYDMLKSINLKDKNTFGFREGNVMATTEQYVQHYPREVASYDTKGFKYNENESELIVENVNLFTNSVKNIFYVALPSTKTKSGFKLYKHMGDLKYIQIDTLGDKDLRETDYYSNYAKTTIVSNKSKYTEPKKEEIPTEQENKEFLKVDQKEVFSDIKDVPPESVKGYDYEYGLRDNDTPGIKKIGNALNHIITKSDNKFYSWYANQLLDNLDKLPSDLSITLDVTLNAEGRTNYDSNYRPTGIDINLLNIDTKEDFERVILHELTHAFTKEAIYTNKDSETIQRLKELHKQFQTQVRYKYTDEVIEKVMNEIKSGSKISVKIKDARIIRAAMNFDEFITEAMSNKDVQNKLDSFTPNKEFKNAWENFKSLISDILEVFGFSKGKALDYVISNVISLIDTPKADTNTINSLTGKINRTVEWVNKKFNLNALGESLDPKTNPEEIKKWIEDNISNLNVEIQEGKYIVVTDKNIKSDFSISSRAAQDSGEELPVSKLLKARRTRIATLNRLINKADSNNEFAKAEDYKQQRQDLIDSIDIINKYTSLEDVYTVAREDLDEVSNMLDKNLSESDILYALKITNLWQKGIDIFFDEDTITSENLRNDFKGIEGTAEYYGSILYNKLVDLTNKFVKDHTGIDGDINVEQIMASIKDISKIESNVLNLSRNDNALLGAIYNSVKKANYAALDESREIVEELNKLIETISPLLGKRGEKYEVFRQKFSDGLYTGNLVGKFTPEFENHMSSLNWQLSGITKADAFKRHAKKRKETVVTFDVRKLFPNKDYESKYTDKQREDYKQELKDLLGNAAYEIEMNKQQRMIERYSEDREHNRNRILSKYNMDNDTPLKSNINAYNEFKIWVLQNSPYETASQLLEEKAYTVEDKFITPLSTQKYLVEVPRKTDKNGKDLKFYDNNFSEIENNKDLLEFYNYITDVFDKLKIYLPQSVQDRIQFGGLPEISKTFLELSYDVKGGKEAMSVLWNQLKESIRTEDTSDITYADIDPITGRSEKRLSIDIMKDNKQFYKDYIFRKSVEWKQENNKEDIPKDLIERWGREAKNELAQKKSYDLGKVVKAYSMLVLAYKHKSRIEDQLKAAEVILNESREMELSAKKKPLKNERGEIQYKNQEDSFINMKASLDYFMDTFYGHSRKLEGITDKEVLNSEESDIKQKIQDLLASNQTQFDNKEIKEEVYLNTKKQLEDQLDKLGGVKVWSKVGDNILKYIQLKVMGWNLFSGFSNVGFGWIANFIEAADGRVFNSDELLNAYKLVLHSIGKNLTFGKVKSDTATKIRNLMERFDVLKDMSNELYQNSIPSQFTKKVKWLSPYNITQRTEYINQAPLMIALMNRIKTEDGKSLWEQFDKDGNWIGEGEIPSELITKFRLKLDGIIEKTHGDYGSPLKIKEKILGRSLIQFRTWMFEGFAQRFEPEKYDPNLEMVRKGRYITLSNNYFKKLGFIGGLADLGTNLLRKLAFQSTRFDNLTDGEIFNEVDAANMRKVLSEITIYMSITTTAIMLKMLSGNLDDKEKYLANYLINHSSRLRTDILFYFNPIEFRNLLRDPIPAATLIKDVTEWSYAAGKLVIGKDIIPTGVYAGESRIYRETMQLLPFGTQIYRNISASKTQY